MDDQKRVIQIRHANTAYVYAGVMQILAWIGVAAGIVLGVIVMLRKDEDGYNDSANISAGIALILGVLFAGTLIITLMSYIRWRVCSDADAKTLGLRTKSAGPA